MCTLHMADIFISLKHHFHHVTSLLWSLWWLSSPILWLRIQDPLQWGPSLPYGFISEPAQETHLIKATNMRFPTSVPLPKPFPQLKVSGDVSPPLGSLPPSPLLDALFLTSTPRAVTMCLGLIGFTAFLSVSFSCILVWNHILYFCTSLSP